MKVEITLTAEVLGTSGDATMEKTAHELSDSATPKEIAEYIGAIADKYPLHKIEWLIEKRGFVLPGSYNADSGDSVALLEADITELLGD